MREPDLLPSCWKIFNLVAQFDDAVNQRGRDEFGISWMADAVWAIGDPIYLKQDGDWLFKHERCLYLWLSSEKLPGNGASPGREHSV